MTRLKKNGFSILSSAFLVAVFSSLSPVRISAEEAEAHKGTLQNWEMYGSVRLQGAYWNRYKWYKKVNNIMLSQCCLTRSDSDAFLAKYPIGSTMLDTLPTTRFQMGLQNNSYFGVRGKGEKFGFGFEMGLSTFLEDIGLDVGSTGTTADLSLSQRKRQSTFLRKIYGDWFINDLMSLRIGQDWNLANFFISNQIFNHDAGLGYSGVLYTGRRPQLKLTVGRKQGQSLTWKTQAAIIKQDMYTLPSNFGVNSTTEEKVPKLEFGADIEYEISDLIGIGAKGVGGLTQYDAVIYHESDPNNPLMAGGDRRSTIKSNLFGINMDLRVWKAKASVCYARGQNLGSYGVWLGNPDAPITDPSMVMFFPWPDAVVDTAGVPTGKYKISNAKTWQAGAVLNVQPLSWLAVEAGYGTVRADHEDTTFIPSLSYNPANSTGNLNAMKRFAYYANLQFLMAEGHLQIIPEYSFTDLGGFQGSKSNEAGGKWHSFALKLELDI